MRKTLTEIAAFVGGEVVGDGNLEIVGLESIEGAGENDLIFAVEPHIEEAKDSKAAAVMLGRHIGEFPKPTIRVDDPRASFAKLLDMFAPRLNVPTEISDKAYIGKNVTIGKDVTIYPLAMIDDNAIIGDRVVIYPHAYIGQYTEIESDSVIYPSVVIREYTHIGKRCVIHNGASIGADGFGFTTAEGVHTKVPQIGNIIIEDDVEIGANVGIDRAAMGSTVIGKGTKIDNLVHIGHNCKIGANCLIVAQTGISGSTVVGDNVTFGGQTGTVGHIKIGGNSTFAARSGITNDTPENYFAAGFPAQPHASWLRLKASLNHVPEMRKELKRLAKVVEELIKGK
ncbi:MAG: UDP-3-O-(3-hydroxymyristoyl)glucosamine N-acyltransferase [Selenomonadaceae bacterium]|nr:UDP-3-O-(3-hydroxymyristoyl)glucosamine N-acyltransferase [Selenomonadaceae bacterium]MBP3723309.1 UDP-3-O-(3-hydroxymyristoyl)glucosamine N-acyltransferase [Selenomonadaceae bacterium]